jgi:hypothetical protein
MSAARDPAIVIEALKGSETYHALNIRVADARLEAGAIRTDIWRLSFDYPG